MEPGRGALRGGPGHEPPDAGRPFLADTQVDFAAMLIERGRPRDRRAAAAHLDEAPATATHLGMARAGDRGRALLAAA